MRPEQVVARAREIAGNCGRGRGMAALTEGRQLVRQSMGERNSYFEQLQELNSGWNDDFLCERLRPLMESFALAVESGWLGGPTLRRQAELEVVSDILEQAEQLLRDEAVHPAGPAMIVGAALEEFLRTWIEDEALSIGSQKPGMNSYAGALRAAERISKQDVKDITAWAGTRNSAAHGQWDEVGDPARVRLMLEGVNLFMRKHGDRNGV